MLENFRTNVLKTQYRHCQASISFKTTESDLDATLESCSVSVCSVCLDKGDATLEPCVT